MSFNHVKPLLTVFWELKDKVRSNKYSDDFKDNFPPSVVKKDVLVFVSLEFV